MSKQNVKLGDYLFVLAFCLALFTLVLAVGGPLTMHEGVLSQTSRQMAADHDWVVPHFGEAPWLERPPLPQWITVAISSLFGGCDREWIVRLGSALAGTITVMLTVWLGGALLGRVVGVLGGLTLATMYEFLRYSTLAEADIFLCPIVTGCLTLFAYLELVRPQAPPTSEHAAQASAPLACAACSVLKLFLGTRPWPVLGFFVLLGMTNLAKGIVFGTAMTLVPIGGYLVINGRIGPILRYCWLWGWLAFAAVALAWPIAVYQRFPDVLQLWDFDLRGRLDGDYLAEPVWYYFVNWFWVVLPWPLAAITGLRLTAGKAIWERNSPQRFLWCWALLTPVVFSFAHGKHHHYMLHYLAPWGILASLGLVRAWETVQTWPRWLKMPVVVPLALAVAGDVALFVITPSLEGSFVFQAIVLLAWPALIGLLWWYAMEPRPQTALVGFFSVLLVLYWLGFSYKSKYLHRSNEDTAFLREAIKRVPQDEPLLVHAADEALEGLRVLFYCPERTVLLHNMTFLRDDRLQSPSLWILARGNELPVLRRYGEVDVKLQSKKNRREEGKDVWTLFHLQMRSDVTRVHNHVRISPMQAMYRDLKHEPRLD